MQLLKKRTLMSLGKFLTLSLFAFCLGGCASNPPATTFDADWEFINSPLTGMPKACLSEEDGMKLKEILIRARAWKH